jgi:hypothetical protein
MIKNVVERISAFWRKWEYHVDRVAEDNVEWYTWGVEREELRIHEAIEKFS